MRASTWGGLTALWLAVLGASLWALQPPAPLPRDAPADRFSEGRARDLVRRLSEDIGLRVNGTPGHTHAAELLAAELRRIPRVEVEIQPVSATQIYRSVKLPAFVYQTVNVVARLPGRLPRAILLDAHFDTLIDSVGAADDAAGVAALVETVRVLAREAPLERTVILNLNGGEEAGLFGAAGFLSHRWARDVDAYLYLEALPGGKAGLFGAGPGEPWLAETYARVAPAPLGNVVGQDLVQSGLLPHNGDFTPFHEAGLGGLDVAMTGDGWAYHTALDRLARLQPGGLQHMGDTALAVTRALGNRPPTAGARPDPEPVVYYDILGLTMATYRVGTARVLAFAALLLAALALVVSWRRRVISAGGALAALGWTAGASLAGLVAAVAAGVLLGRVLGRPHGWFSAPVLVLPAFAAPALAAMLAVRALWRRRALRRTTADRHAAEAWAGALLFWWLWLALATIAAPRLGAAYLALHWVLGGAAGALLPLLPARWARARPALALLCLLPGTVLTVELGVVFLKYFVPIAGLLPAPLDFLVAALVGLVVVATGAAGLAVPHRTGGWSRGALGCAAVAIVGLVVTALHFPYSAERPKRVVVAQAADDNRSAILMASGDALDLRPVLSDQPGFVSARPGWPPYEAWLPPFSHERPAPPPALAAPRIDVVSDRYDSFSDRRSLYVRITAPGAQVRLALPAERLVGSDLSPEAVLVIGGQALVHLEGLSDDEENLLPLTIKGSAPLPIEVRAIDRRPADSPEIRAVRERLPPWTTPTLVSVRSTRLSL